MKTKLRSCLRNVLILTSITTLAACATSNYSSKNTTFYSLFNSGKYELASERLKISAEKAGKDQILFLLDLGMTYFEAGKYKDAIDVFSKAERLTELKEYTSVSEEAVSLMTSDATRVYRPMDYERIMINVYLALSYLLTGSNEGAMVECRRINNLVYKLKNEGLKDYEESPFAWYLSGTIYEAEKKYDDARIDYENAKRIKPESELFRSEAKSDCGNCGKLIVIYSSMSVPKKIVDPNNKQLPAYKKNIKPSGQLEIYDATGLRLGRTYEIMDVQETAIKNLKERIRILKNKKIAATAIKGAAAIAAGALAKDKDVGIATFFILEMLTATKPDLRSWATLPQSIQVAKLELTEGEKLVKLVPQIGTYKLDEGKEFPVKIEKGKTKFIVYRYLKRQ